MSSEHDTRTGIPPEIDRQLEQVGWIVQDYRQMNISAELGLAVREFPLNTRHADYML